MNSKKSSTSLVVKDISIKTIKIFPFSFQNGKNHLKKLSIEFLIIELLLYVLGTF